MTFEGTEGAGKSTLIREVAARLQEQGYAVTLTREPGGSPVAERIRAVILEEPMDPWAELFLYEAARAEHLARTVRPALALGHVVLCDRFSDSSLAYQAHARGLPWPKVKALNQAATQGLAPDMTVLLDIDPAVGLRRARDPNRFEDEGVEFQKKVRSGFLKSRREEPRRWFTVRAESGTPAQLAEKVLREFHQRSSQSSRKRASRG
ncbi:MAG: dTMP kinase [Oligoflexia bacterium]|nr:dTMP kinase [Oligoflexia bacterium]